jgi:hypothetical protein
MPQTTIYDFDLFGTIDENGKIKELYNKEAVENSILIWLTSYNTDIIRNPGNGGYLTQFLHKQMSEQIRRDIYESLIDGFNQDFNLVVILNDLQVIPDYENKTWKINIEAYIPEIKDSITVSALVRNLI